MVESKRTFRKCFSVSTQYNSYLLLFEKDRKMLYVIETRSVNSDP